MRKRKTMHELSLTRSILGICLEEAEKNKLKKVSKINICAGEIHNYEEKWIQYYFDIASKGTLCSGARTKLTVIPVKFHCRDCGADFSLDIRKDDKMVCKSCGGSNYKMTAGREFYISSMEGE